MRIFEETCVAISAVANGVAASQAPTNGTALTLATTAAALSPARRITIISASVDFSGINFTIKGTDRSGNAISEVLTGPGGGLTVTSALVYSSVTSITPNGSNAGLLTSGWGTENISPWVWFGNFKEHYVTTLRAFLPSGGSANYDIEGTSDYLPKNQNSSGDNPDDLFTLTPAAQTAAYTSYNGYPLVGIRLKLHSGGPVTMRIVCSRTG